jgi:hypothetical protein
VGVAMTDSPHEAAASAFGLKFRAARTVSEWKGDPDHDSLANIWGPDHDSLGVSGYLS